MTVVLTWSGRRPRTDVRACAFHNAETPLVDEVVG